MKRSVILTVFSLLVLAQLGLAQVPQTFSYQGVLRDASGNIVDNGVYTLGFKLWSAAEGGTELWTELQSVPVIDGIFSAVLGVSETFSSTAADFESPLWLEMWIEAGPGVTGLEFLSPRIELTAVPYAIKSRGVAGSTNVFPGTGKVGIGTAAPGAKLHIASPNADGIALVDLNSGNWSAALLNWEGVGGQLSLLDGGEVPQVKIRGFASDGVQAYFTAGNVGIGTITPSAELEVVGGIKADSLILPITTRYYSIPNAAFMPPSDTTRYSRSQYWLYPTYKPAEFFAPLNLPHGAVIKELQVTVKDDSTQMILAYLWKTSLSTGAVSSYTGINSGLITGVGTFSGNYTIPVDNQSYAYMVRVYFQTKGGDGFCVYGARIKYTVATPLP